MDPLKEGCNELETAFLKFDRNARASGSLKRKTTHVSRSVPGSYVSTSSDESNSSDAADDSRTATPPRPTTLSRHHSGLPPTPPTMTNSDLAESQVEGRLSPAPAFADRVRNALEVQKSGPSTPVMENQTPPTPDPSPPSNPALLKLQRPELRRCPSSYADSFETAREAKSADGSVDKEAITSEEETTPRRHSWMDMNKVLGLSNARFVLQEVEAAQHYDSDKGEPRVKNYQADSDSEMDKNSCLASDERSLTEGSRSPSLRKAVTHRPVLQRLRKPFQPGDEIKRPDESLLYGSLASIKWKEARAHRKNPPQREMDTEVLRNAQPALEHKEPQGPRAPEMFNSNSEQHDTLTALPPIPPEERRAMSPESRATVASKLDEIAEKPQERPPSTKLREFAPSEAPADTISPPNTAQKASLEENNKVYKLIQEENAKRHSAISDGSVQAMITPIPENKRKLRHTMKRDSLRGDVSMADSKRSSSDNSHRLRHKSAMKPLGSSEPALSPEQGKDLVVKKASARVPRFGSGENGFDQWSGAPNLTPKMKAVAPARVLGNPQKLRRSSRANSIDRARSVSDSAAKRPLSMESSAFSGQAFSEGLGKASPHLRRFSAEHRLENNFQVRRTSLSRDSQGISSPIEIKLEKPAEDLTSLSQDSRALLSPAEPKLDRVAEELTSETREVREGSGSFIDRGESSIKSTTSPRRKSLDYRHLHPVTTPMSTSQWSGTDAELCEAKGVAFYPHHNESLLIVQSGRWPRNAPSRILEADAETAQTTQPDAAPEVEQPAFQAIVDAPTESLDAIGKPKHSVDSPLTNPRAAPEPPVIKFIPPTPIDELERQLGDTVNPTPALDNPRAGLQRSLSLTERIRRYGENLVQPRPFGRSGSVRRSQQQRRRSMPAPGERPTYLSSFWQPRDFWEEYDSEDEEDDDYEPLPPGGDTSEVDGAKGEKRMAKFIPRSMSRRMSGFRGTGGFLQGNSLGIDRHGTNVRRHYIDRRTSEEMLRRFAERQQRRRTFTLPFSGGTRVEYVGLAGLGAKMRDVRRRRDDQALEKRREKLRGQIGTRVYHYGRCGVP